MKISFLHLSSVRIRNPDEPFRRNCSRLVPDSRNNFCNYIYIYMCVCVCVCVCYNYCFTCFRHKHPSHIHI